MLLLAALTWILGAGSLALFGLFLFEGSLGLIDLRLTHRALLFWDAALCVVFFLQHSVLIRRTVQSSLKKVIPDQYYGVTYTLSSAVALSALVFLWQQSDVELYAMQEPGRWMMWLLLLLAFLGVLWGIRSLESFDAFGIDKLLAHRRRKQLPPLKLTVAGPYRLVRHPFYALGIMALWATPVLSLDRLLLNVLFTAWILLGAALEERDLLADFGEDYARYRNQVPMLVPTRLLRPTKRTPEGKAAFRGRAA